MNEQKIKPSDLQAEAERLITNGTMPDLATLLKAVGEVREEYRPKILKARAKRK